MPKQWHIYFKNLKAAREFKGEREKEEEEKEERKGKEEGGAETASQGNLAQVTQFLPQERREKGRERNRTRDLRVLEIAV